MSIDAVPALQLQEIASNLEPRSLSRFRNVNKLHRDTLYPTLVEALGHAKKKVTEALRVLAKISNRDDTSAITALAEGLENESPTVRNTAINSLAQITAKGNPSAIKAVPESGRGRSAAAG